MNNLLSEHFSLAEAIASETAERKGINNTPDSNVIKTMYKSAIGMEKIRVLLGNKPLHINSWYRCPELNSAIGSHQASQHLKGEAIDFIAPIYGDCVSVCKAIIASADIIRFDQLILEHTWVHVSFAILTCKPRNQVISLLATGKYSIGLTNKEGHNL